MGWARAVVAVVMSIISLAVLSLHVALCVHYPSPLFAVTLLLNPSLWMFLGAAGMGCALALTYRERQRKVRAALCTTCHARYGATLDSKCRGSESQWRDGHGQRGPSRAIYSYNGNSHKFYASYGTINEKQNVNMKSPPLLDATSGRNTTKQSASSPLNIKSPISSEPPDTKSNDRIALSVVEDKDSEDMFELQKRLELKTNGEVKLASLPQDGNGPETRAEIPRSGDIEQQPSENPSLLSLTEATLMPAVNGDASVDSQGAGDSDSRTSSTSLEERLPCDCLARYAVMNYRSRQQYYRAAAYGSNYRRHYTHQEIRAIGKYHKKLLMHCKLRDPNDVPVELFAARHSSVENCPREKNVSSKRAMAGGCSDGAPTSRKPSDTHETNSYRSPQIGDRHAKTGIEADQARLKSNLSTSARTRPETIASSEPVSPENRFFTLGKVKGKDFYYPPTAQLLPVKHSPPSPIQTPTIGQWSTASPPSVTSESLHQNPTQDQSNHDSIQSPIHEVSQNQEPQCQDLDVASVSSESGLLPASNKASLVGRDFLKSPLWRSFRGSKKEPKTSVGVDVEEHSQSSHHDDDSDSAQPESIGSQHRSGQHRLRSLLSSSRRVLTKPKRMRFSGSSERRTPWRMSQASPSSTSRDNPDSVTSPKERRSLSLTSNMRKSAKFMATSKKGSTSASPLPSSPARAVKSLVMRNIHRTTGKSSRSSGFALTPETTASFAVCPSDTADSREPQAVSPPPYSASPASTSSSPCQSVRPKERKKQKTRLKSKHHTGSTDSVMLLSDDTTE
ncbi:hypothetical protein OTU49_006094 [Cherax quadricarinatus]|uniref:Uncharacterized protein n=1 Tax=Cherax quadricarinatus TaxID=27406 RepID=A0AAW0WPV2_CHEQU